MLLALLSAATAGDSHEKKKRSGTHLCIVFRLQMRYTAGTGNLLPLD